MRTATVQRSRYHRYAKTIRMQRLAIATLLLLLFLSLVIPRGSSSSEALTGTLVHALPSPNVEVQNDAEPAALPTAEPETPAEPEETLTLLGEFKLTAYCPCEKCCGKSVNDPYYGITASGTTATAGRTIAVDTRVIPMGSEIVINGHTYIAEDVGGAIKENRIDIYFDSHDEALQFGVQYADVYIKSNNL